MFGKVIHFSWPKKGLRLLLAPRYDQFPVGLQRK